MKKEQLEKCSAVPIKSKMRVSICRIERNNPHFKILTNSVKACVACGFGAKKIETWHATSL